MQLEKAHIAAPFAGIVGLRNVSVGEYISAGQALVNLEAIDPVKADFRVPEKFLSAIRVGQTIRIKVDAFPGEGFEGKVYAIDPHLDVSGGVSSSGPSFPTKTSAFAPACSRG